MRADEAHSRKGQRRSGGIFGNGAEMTSTIRLRADNHGPVPGRSSCNGARATGPVVFRDGTRFRRPAGPPTCRFPSWFLLPCCERCQDLAHVVLAALRGRASNHTASLPKCMLPQVDSAPECSRAFEAATTYLLADGGAASSIRRALELLREAEDAVALEGDRAGMAVCIAECTMRGLRRCWCLQGTMPPSEGQPLALVADRRLFRKRPESAGPPDLCKVAL